MHSTTTQQVLEQQTVFTSASYLTLAHSLVHNGTSSDMSGDYTFLMLDIALLMLAWVIAV
jgi:hypothetical protein